MHGRYLVTTIDTEIDRDAAWHVSDPPTFASIRKGIPEVLSPLFESFGIRPTYLVSAEVLEDADSVAVLNRLGDEAELGTHLHADFVEPRRLLTPETMAASPADSVQCTFPPDIEAQKLATLTELFETTFGRRPIAFRAGRFGIGERSLEILARLGYRVDSSVTPGLLWRYEQTVLDFRDWSTDPRWVSTPGGRILELPVGIRPGGFMAPLLTSLPGTIGRAARKLAGPSGRHLWLRPSWGSAGDLVRYVDGSHDRFLVLMFHSTEVIPGATPYAASHADVDGLVGRLCALFEHCELRGIKSVTLTEAADLVG